MKSSPFLSQIIQIEHYNVYVQWIKPLRCENFLLRTLSKSNIFFTHCEKSMWDVKMSA